MKITLEQHHIEFADALAVRRQAAAVARRRAARNGAPGDGEAALAYHRIGTRCECAGYLWAKPVKWHAFVEDIRNLPDLDHFIDVKGVGKATGSLAVQRKNPAHWAYLLVAPCPAHPTYFVVGWAWGYEVKLPKFWGDPIGGMPAYFIEQGDPILKPPAVLLSVLRVRQRSAAARDK